MQAAVGATREPFGVDAGLDAPDLGDRGVGQPVGRVPDGVDQLDEPAPQPGVTDQEAVKYATTVAETVRRRLGAPSPDPALVVDADLRPEGRSGPLVRTLASYAAYYAR